MRRFLIMLLVLSGGAAALWHFEQERQDEMSRDGGAQMTDPVIIAPRVDTGAGDFTDGASSIEADPEATTEGDGEEAFEVYDGESAYLTGAGETWRSPRTADEPRIHYVITEQVPTDSRGLSYDLMGVIFSSYRVGAEGESDPRSEKDDEAALNSRIKADRARVQLNTSNIAGKFLQENLEVDLFGVTAKLFAGTPFAPLELEAPQLKGSMGAERLRSVGEDLVEFESLDIRGTGQGLDARLRDGSLEFLRGADVEVDIGKGRTVRVATPEGGPLSIVDETELPEPVEGEAAVGRLSHKGPRNLRVLARDGVHVELKDRDGSAPSEKSLADDEVELAKPGGMAGYQPLTIDSASMEMKLITHGSGEGVEMKPTIQAAWAWGKVTIRHGRDVYRGETARVFFENGEPVRVILEKDPTLTYTLRDEVGQEVELLMTGQGPITIHLAGGAPDNPELRFVFVGPGRVKATSGRGGVVTFDNEARGNGVQDRSRATVLLAGDVHVDTAEGTLTSAALIATYRAGHDLRAATDGETLIVGRHPETGDRYHVRANGGLTAHLEGEAWFIDRAADIHAESFGKEPHRVRAGLITDVDVAAQTLTATGSIFYESLWGRARAKKALVRTAKSVTLMGTAEDLVALDLISGSQGLIETDADAEALRSGWVNAEQIRIDASEVLAERSVASQIETLEGVWGFDAHELILRREVTGESFVVEGDSPGPEVGAFRADKMEDVFVTARFVREARYDTDKGNAVIAADRVEIEAGAAPALPEGAAHENGPKKEKATFDPNRTARLQAFGRVTVDMESYGPERDEQGLPTVQQTWNLAASSAAFERLPVDSGEDARLPFELTALEVTECRFAGADRLVELSADAVTIDGEFGALEDGQKLAEQDLVGSRVLAEGHVDLRYKTAMDQPAMVGRCHRLTLTDGVDGRMEAKQGRRVHVVATLPDSELGYTIEGATKVDFTEEKVTAETAEADVLVIKLANAVRVESLGFPVKKITTHKLTATRAEILFSGETFVTRADAPELEPAKFTNLRIRADQLKELKKSVKTIGPFDPVPPQDEDLLKSAPTEQEAAAESGPMTIPLEGGGELTSSDFRLEGTTMMLRDAVLDEPTQGLSLDAEWVNVETTTYAISAGRGAVRGVGTTDWTMAFASIESRVIGDEMMVSIIAPQVTHGDDSARADYLCLWVDRNRWQALCSNALPFGKKPEPVVAQPASESPERKPNFLAEILFELQDQKYGGYVRALFMEGGVEVVRRDRRAARGSRLYIDLPKAVAWLEDAELAYPLQSRGKEVPLRVRTQRLGTDEEGRLTANDATLTTCDHDVPHFVVRTKEFALEPRPGGRWRFGASGNRLKFTDGVSLPLPSIGNLVLDEDFGVEGFENEAGEVTPLSDIGIARTARFGTVLGAAFRFDIGNVGEWVAERIGMDSSKIRGKWDTEAQYLSGRGPLLGLGLQLREREPGDDPNEDFRLDAFIGGIVDGGEDRGTVRVDESDHDDLRVTGYARARYPIVRGEWVDFAVATQTDAGVQAEFYESDFLKFDQRDTFVRWRKSYGADYLAAGAQKRINNFRSQKEELPSFSAYRGERQIGTFTGVPVLWGGSFDMGYLRRREGDPSHDLFSDLPGGATAGVGDQEAARADLSQRLSFPIQTSLAGIRATPFLEARGTAWTNALDDGDDPSRAAAFTGLELSTTLHKVTDNGYLHALAPRVVYSTDIANEETGGSRIPFDATEQQIDGTRYEVGLRSLWQRPGTFENLDFDLSAIFRQDRDGGLEDEGEFATLAHYITRYGDGEGQVGVRHDARYDLETSETTYSRSSLAIRPNDSFLVEFRYSQARAFDASELFETGGILGRWRVDPKWELETRYSHDLKNDRQLLTELTVRRFAHDFVFDITFQDRSGEGGTNVSFDLMPLLGWTASRIGMLDR